MIFSVWEDSTIVWVSLMSIVKIGHTLPKRKNAPAIFLYVVQYIANYQKMNRNLKKYWGKIDSFLPWTKNLKWTLRPSFCTQVKSSCVFQYIFMRSFDFGTKQKLCPKKFMPGFGHSQKSALLMFAGIHKQSFLLIQFCMKQEF